MNVVRFIVSFKPFIPSRFLPFHSSQAADKASGRRLTER
jgi:hypothetical protein